ncbi:lanthionine synthetase C family protein [Streptomyces sp. SDT5-1]|uniref:lanthionine synthetase C family protein n=1 Tax=Streptomyces sp. SDT5-1 TaxID=3406418 RepID=UPI003FD19B30
MKGIHDLGNGLAGTAVYEMVMARHRGVWEGAHTVAKALASRPVTSHPATASLYRGAPAVAYALHTGAHPAYVKALEYADREVTAIVERRLTAAFDRMRTGRPPRLREYDLISGLTGLGAYLLHRGHTTLLQHVLGYLVRLLTEPVAVSGLEVPGWWAADSPRGRYDEHWPHGHANFGLAHGVAGPVALLALSARAGITVANQNKVLHEGIRILTHWARPLHGGGTGWPEALDLAKFQRGPLPLARPTRPSWCYGTPGIARALQLAALACANASAQHLAEKALLSCVTDRAQTSQLNDATVCHGWAGLLLTVERAAADAADDTLERQLPRLHTHLTNYLVQHDIPHSPGLLTGTDGILLALHTLSPSHPATATWETCLLLT